MNTLAQIGVTILTTLYWILVSYPIIGAIAWLGGVLCYQFLFKHRLHDFADIPVEEEPLISILIPAHNEEVSIQNTISYNDPTQLPQL